MDVTCAVEMAYLLLSMRCTNQQEEKVSSLAGLHGAGNLRSFGISVNTSQRQDSTDDTTETLTSDETCPCKLV